MGLGFARRYEAVCQAEKGPVPGRRNISEHQPISANNSEYHY
jgi:hypothetical protein